MRLTSIGAESADECMISARTECTRSMLRRV